MEHNRKLRGLSTVLALALSVLAALILVLKPNWRGNEAPTLGYTDDIIEMSFEEIAASADYIMDAVYTGNSVTEYGEELLFHPVKMIKGEMDVFAVSQLHVQPIADLPEQQYEVGKTYMLFLDKHSSVYYEHDKYSQLGSLYIPENDTKWKAYHTQATQIAAQNRDVSTENAEKGYTDATDIDEIIAFSENIFVVRIDSVLAESTVGPTTVYNCTVLKTIKNTPAANGKIYITLFNGTVSVGGEYLMLLADATKTAPVYTLSSAESSVYSLEAANMQPSLKVLLNQAVAYSAFGTAKSDQEILDGEQKAKQ